MNPSNLVQVESISVVAVGNVFGNAGLYGKLLSVCTSYSISTFH